MCQLVSNGAFLKTTKLKNRPIKISLRFAVWSQFYQQALINKFSKLQMIILNVTNQVKITYTIDTQGQNVEIFAFKLIKKHIKPKHCLSKCVSKAYI